MKYDIYLSDLEYNTLVQLPIIPEKLPEVNVGFNNEEFETYDNGYYNLLGNKKLATFTLESFFPEYSGKYQFERSSNTWDELLTILAISTDDKKAIKVVFGNNKDVIMDANFTVESFKYNIDKTGDYQYSIDFKEYREVKINV